MHHLSGTPCVSSCGEIQLAGNGTVYLCMITHNDTGFVWQVFGTFHRYFWIKKAHQSLDSPVQQCTSCSMHMQVSFA